MSTRAIIGIRNEDGTITGGWQWNDGICSNCPVRKTSIVILAEKEKI